MKASEWMSIVWRWLNESPGGGQGVSGFRAWRFWVVVLLYMGSFLCFVRDPFFQRAGAFTYQQGMVTLENWQLRMLGRQIICLPNQVVVEIASQTQSVPQGDQPDV